MKILLIFIFILNILSEKYVDILFITDIHLDLLYDSHSLTSSRCRKLNDTLTPTLEQNDFGK
jgi:hypothetical protein